MPETSVERFEVMLTGGHPNSLGRTVEVVDAVLAKPYRLSELYDCYFSPDEVVRLRTSSALKRVCAERPEWLLPYVDGLLRDVSRIDQPSVQWTLAQLMENLNDRLTARQKSEATRVLQHDLQNSNDWIVLNTTMNTLGGWAREDAELRSWLEPHLLRLAQDSRKSVSRRARKLQEELATA
jgi:hypothetical protein